MSKAESLSSVEALIQKLVKAVMQWKKTKSAKKKNYHLGEVHGIHQALVLLIGEKGADRELNLIGMAIKLSSSKRK